MEEVVGIVRTRDQQFQRATGATQYTAGDVITTVTSGTIITFGGISRDGRRGGIIQEALLIDSANQATKLDAELYLFDTTVTVPNDNAAFAPTDAELRTLVGVIPFLSSNWKIGTVTSGADGNAVNQVSGLSMPFNVKVATNDLFGVLVARNAYTPVDSEIFAFRLKVLD